MIEDAAGTSFFYLNHLDGDKLPLPVDGQVLKMFYEGNI
jgi:hypothetical protein